MIGGASGIRACRIALTGGIACGKSLLSRLLSRMGARIIDADDVVHELESPGGEAVAPIVARFGPGVLAPGGGIDRRRLAEMVFCAAGGAGRAELESILFPMVRRRIAEFFEDGRTTSNDQPPPPPTAADCSQSAISIAIIPLLFESHWETEYDIIVSLVSGHEAQVRRMAETRGMSREQAEARIAAQMPVAEKAARADYVIENNSTPDALYSEAVRLVEWLRSKIRG